MFFMAMGGRSGQKKGQKMRRRGQGKKEPRGRNLMETAPLGRTLCEQMGTSRMAEASAVEAVVAVERGRMAGRSGPS